MTTPDFPDWAQPVGLIDRATRYGNAAWALSNGQVLSAVDSSRYMSVGLAIQLSNSVAGKRYVLRIDWKESGIIVDTDILSFHSGASYTAPLIGNLYWQVPVRGSTFDLTLLGSDAANVFVNVLLSTRELTGGKTTVRTDCNGRLLNTSGSFTLPAGATLGPMYVPPTSEAVSLTWNMAIASGVVTVAGVNGDGPGPTTQNLGRYAIAGAAANEIRYYAPCTGLECSWLNNDASGHTGTMNIWDTSP